MDKELPSSASKRKIDAIYELREAAEQKGRRENILADHPSQDHRDQLLDSLLEVEEKTDKAISACHECGHEHEPDAPHGPKKP